MSIRSVRKPSLAMLLTLAILVGTTPDLNAVFARGNSVSSEITAFAPLDEEIEKQAVIVGGSIDEVYLPTTLTATVQIATDTDTQEEEAEPSVTTEEMEIPVTWDCSPTFDASQTGVHTFTSTVDGYTVSAELPQITVGVIQGIQTYSTSYDLTAITASIDGGTNSGTGWSHANNIITFSEAGAITISGTASGYSVVVSASTDITLAAGTEITGKERYAALSVPGGATITGGGTDVNITGGTSNHDSTLGHAIQSNGAITLAGVFGAIKGGHGGSSMGGYGISTVGDIAIAEGAEVGSITGGASSTMFGGGWGIHSSTGDIVIAGTITGDIIGGNNTRSDGSSGRGGHAIYANLGSVTITETGIIGGICGGDSIVAAGGIAIYAGTEVVISGTTGTITAGNTSSTTIIGGNTILGMNGVTISGTTGTITGGTTNGSRQGSGISANQGHITLTGQIADIVSADYAIRGGNTNVTVTIGDNILNDGEYRLIFGSLLATITVSDGLMFVSGNGTNRVSYADDGSGAMFSLTGAGTTYTARTWDDISISPATAIAYWTTSGGDCGIRYENGGNTGFIPIVGVTLNKLSPAWSDLVYTIPTGHVYDGSPKGIGSVTLTADQGTGHNATTGGVVTVYYDGSTTVPTDAGTYAVTADISGGTDYQALSILLGNYTIEKAPLAITGGTVATKIYDSTVVADVTAVTFSGLQNSETLALGTDYIVIGATFDNANAGSSKTVTDTVSLVEDGSVTKNYTLPIGSLTLTGQSITQATAASIATSIPASITKTAYEARSAVNTADIVTFAGLPSTVSVATDGGTLTMPIIWSTSDGFDAEGTTYNFTGTLTGDANIDANGITANVAINITPVTAVNPTFGDILVVENTTDTAATAADLGESVLPTSGNLTIEGESIAYTIVWDTQTLDRTTIDDEVTFMGTISYPGAPAWLNLPGTFTVSRKVTVTPKQPLSITGMTVSNKVYDGAVYTPTGTINAGAVNTSDLIWLWESTDGGGYSSATAPTNAGDYKLTLSVPSSHPTHAGSVEFTFSITKRPLTLTAEDKSILLGSSAWTLTYTIQNLAPGESKADAIDVEPILNIFSFNSNIAGDYPITIIGGTVTDNYSFSTVSGTLTVEKGYPTYTVPTGLTATYGDTLADVVLPTGFTWEDADSTPVGNAGTNTFAITFTPTDMSNYHTVTGIVVSLTVTQTPPPVRPVQPPVTPTQPPVPPVQPPVTPTQPPVPPVQPPVTPTQPPVPPVQPPVTPTQPPVSPVQPPVSPTQPPVNPVQPPVVEHSNLQDKTTNIKNENLAGSDYTKDSWAALQDAFTKAEEVLSNPNATQVEIDAAMADLLAARNNLKNAVPGSETGAGTLKSLSDGRDKGVSSTSKAAKTGDTTNTLMLMAMCLISGSVIVVLAFYKRKRKTFC